MSIERIGDKIISKEKIYRAVDAILALRIHGMSQQEVARSFNTDRAFISRLENLGEIRKGRRTALVGFPVQNCVEIEEKAKEQGIDYCLLMTEKQRWAFVQEKSGLELVNELTRIVRELRACDVVIAIGSDERIRWIQAMLDHDVIPVSLGASPLATDCYVDPDVIAQIMRPLKPQTGGKL